MSTLSNIRAQFPILNQEVHGHPLVYLDNGASTQRPQSVITAIDEYYKSYHSNVHRGVHYLSSLATEAMESARKKVQTFLNAPQDKEVMFTSGVTHAINTIAHGIEGVFVSAGDEIVISTMEHHSNIVPWQMLCQRSGAVLKVAPISKEGELDMDAFKAMLNERTAIVSIMHVSNTLGTVNPIKDIISAAHQVGALAVVDGAQSVAHFQVDVQDLDCDFFCFSGHKLFGPTGTGILYGKEEYLEKMNPLFGGGEMIKTVTFEETTYNSIPFKFEAGTPNIAGNIGLGAAVDFMNELSWDDIAKHERVILDHALTGLSKIDGLRFVGQAEERSGVISFSVDGMHPFDIGTLLDKLGIAVRTGNHCTEPLMAFFDIPGTVRASFSLYNTLHEVDYLIESLHKVLPMLR